MTAGGRDEPIQRPARPGTHANEKALRTGVLGCACAYGRSLRRLVRGRRPAECVHNHRGRARGVLCTTLLPAAERAELACASVYADFIHAFTVATAVPLPGRLQRPACAQWSPILAREHALNPMHNPQARMHVCMHA